MTVNPTATSVNYRQRSRVPMVMATLLVIVAAMILGAGSADGSAANSSLLAAELDSALATLNALPTIPDTAWGLDPTNGRLVVTVSDAAPTVGVERLLGTASKTRVRLLVRHTTKPLTEQLFDGDQITDGNIICSAGFNVVKNGQAYLITAGHCTAAVANWQGIGQSVATQFPGTDFGLVANDTSPAAGAVDRYDGSSQPIQRVGTATVGEKVCASGVATGLTCGQVLAVDQTVNYDDGQVVHGLIETNVHTGPGDSGGPLFDGGTGLGTVSGGDGQTDYFQPLAPALSVFGVTLAS